MKNLTNESTSARLSRISYDVDRAARFISIAETVCMNGDKDALRQVQDSLEVASAALYRDNADGKSESAMDLITDVADAIYRFEKLWGMSLDEANEHWDTVINRDGLHAARIQQCTADMGIAPPTGSATSEARAATRDVATIGEAFGIPRGRGDLFRVDATIGSVDFESGEYVIVDDTTPAHDGEIVVALLNGLNVVTIASNAGRVGSPVMYPVRARVNIVPVSGRNALCAAA